MKSCADLIVCSHLRWVWVWQRPQQLISRLATQYAERTWFIEEPVATGVAAPRLGTEEIDGVTRVWLEVPGDASHVGFDDPAAHDYPALLAELIAGSSAGPRTTWTYTPLAQPLVDACAPDTIVYDVMDDLASFNGASPTMRLAHLTTLASADVVFTGGKSLHNGVLPYRRDGVVCFPSGVDPSHYRVSIEERTVHERPVAGYVGVIDERIDLDLLDALAEQLPDWDIEIVGPVAKIDEAALPSAPNIKYLGKREYHELPAAMARFDVALMPFALNEATRSISPTKTLEYLAAGLPVVSTRVPDVVSDFGAVVALCDDETGFADACRALVAGERAPHDAAVRALLQWHDWDSIVDRMQRVIATRPAGTGAVDEEALA